MYTLNITAVKEVLKESVTLYDFPAQFFFCKNIYRFQPLLDTLRISGSIQTKSDINIMLYEKSNFP